MQAHGQVIVLGSLLLSSTREVHSPDSEGFTPLHYAAYFGQEGSLVTSREESSGHTE